MKNSTLKWKKEVLWIPGTTDIEDSHPLPILISPSSSRWTISTSRNFCLERKFLSPEIFMRTEWLEV